MGHVIISYPNTSEWEIKTLDRCCFPNFLTDEEGEAAVEAHLRTLATTLTEAVGDPRVGALKPSAAVKREMNGNLACLAGQRAFLEGETFDDCPYTPSARRIASSYAERWSRGFKDVKTLMETRTREDAVDWVRQTAALLNKFYCIYKGWAKV